MFIRYCISLCSSGITFHLNMKLERVTCKPTESVSSASLLPVQQELGVASEIEHADEAPHAACVVLLLPSRSLTSLPHVGWLVPLLFAICIPLLFFTG
uniref:Uncharacterized protein n=1 Tax=Oryza brachyantha TaxID=4533 RepID=J3LJ20_ORYBR